MVSNQGRITTLAADANINKGLVDGTDKLHSGILKALETFTLGSMCVSHAGFTIGSAGGYTQYTLAQPVKFTENGKYITHTSDLTVAYSSTVQDPLYSRYDWVLLDPNLGSLSSNPAFLQIVQGTAGADPIISDIPANKIPIALIHITSGNPSDNDKTDYSFQTYTFDNPGNSLSIVSGNTKLGHIERIGITSNIEIASTANNGNIEITPHGTGDLILDGLKWPQADGSADQVLKTDGSGQLSFVAQSGGGSSLDIDGYSALGGTGLHQTQDHFVFSDNGTEKKISFTNLEDAIFGNVSGDIAIAAGGAATIQANSVALGTDTTGNYMTDISVGTGLDVTHTPAEGSTATVSLDLTEITVSDGLTAADATTLNLDLEEIIATDGANRLLTSDGDGTLTAEANATFDGSTLAVVGTIDGDIIVGGTSVTAPEVTGTAKLTAGGQLYQTPEALDQSIPFSNMSGNQSIVYVGDISNPPTDPSNPGNSNIVDLPDPNTCTHAVYTIRNIGTNPITVEPLVGQIDGGSTDHAYVSGPNIIDLAPGQHVTVQAVTDSVAPLVTGYYIIGN